VIRAERLGKDYRSRPGWRDWRGKVVTGLKEASLEVAAGEIVCVLGENGAGKSTLLKCLAGLATPTRGSGTVAGHDVRTPSAALRRDAIYVAGDPRSFAWRLSGRANLEFFAALHGWARRDAAARVRDVLSQVGLDAAAADRSVAEYSTGMRQRLALARGFLGEPKVLLLDEPTAGIDPRSAASLRDLVRGFAKAGCAVVIATHMIEEARELAARAIVLAQGRVTYSGAVSGALEAALG
jgi:ABC-2 type transport system ATP-binding protein